MDFEAEELASGETIACAYKDFPDHFGFFLPLSGITTVRQIVENSFDIRATSRLNRLYVELLKDNPEWGTAARRHDMNHCMAQLGAPRPSREKRSWDFLRCAQSSRDDDYNLSIVDSL